MATARTQPAPSLTLMHAAFVLAGLGTLLLGPLLPLLAARWHLHDAQSGLLLAAQFCGATAGGASTSARLVRGLLVGLGCAGVGLTCFAFAPSLWPACAAILLGGFGVGRTIATINILAGVRYGERRGPVLARLNFTWSLGALLSPVLAALLTPRVALPTLLGGFAALFAVVWTWLILERSASGDAVEQASQDDSARPAAGMVFAYFAGMILLYGGLETSLSAWLTTYALRYGGHSLTGGEYTLVLLLCGLTGGRALAAPLMARLGDRPVQRASIALSGGSAAALALVHSGSAIAVFAVLLGLCLAPVFPATFSLYMAHQPGARRAGIALAASGIGAAALPWLMGVLSTRTGSLRVALVLPVAAAAAMLALTWLRPGTRGIPRTSAV